VPNFTGPLGRHFGPFSTIFGDTETNVGDTGLTPITLGWHSGNFYWAAGVTGRWLQSAPLPHRKGA
jgi:hypothetical protein